MAALDILCSVLMVAVVGVRCQNDCYLGDMPSVKNARDYISCLRLQLTVMETDINAGAQAILNGAAELAETEDYIVVEDSTSSGSTMMPLTPDEYDLLQSEKRDLEGDETDQTSDVLSLENYDLTGSFPDCRGLLPDQCESLLSFLDQMAQSLTSTGDYYRVFGPEGENFRERRSAQFNAVNAVKIARLLEKKKRNQSTAQRIHKLKTLIQWHKLNGGGTLKKSSKIKNNSRWGRSVDHVMSSHSLKEENTVHDVIGELPQAPQPRLRMKRGTRRSMLKGNFRAMSPKVRQMLAEYLAWKSKQTGYVRLTSRHG